MLDRRIKPRLPVVSLADDAGALLQRVRGVLNVRTRLETFDCVLAGLVAIDLSCDHDVADGHVLHAAGDANE